MDGTWGRIIRPVFRRQTQSTPRRETTRQHPLLRVAPPARNGPLLNPPACLGFLPTHVHISPDTVPSPSRVLSWVLNPNHLACCGWRRRRPRLGPAPSPAWPLAASSQAQPPPRAPSPETRHHIKRNLDNMTTTKTDKTDRQTDAAGTGEGCEKLSTGAQGNFSKAGFRRTTRERAGWEQI